MIQNHAGTIIGVILLAALVWVAAAMQGAHGGHDAVVLSVAASPAPTVAPTPLPTATPAPDPFAPARWAAANVAVISLLLVLGVGLPIGIAMHHWHVSKLPTQDWRIPYRAPKFPRVLDAHVRTSYPPVPQTYSPSLHIRNDPAVEVEEPVSALPALGGVEEFLNHGRGLAYGWRVDNGELLVDRQIRSLLVGGVQGSGKTTFVALLIAQLVRMNARVMLGDPDALNDQGLAYRLTGLGIQPEVMAQEPSEVLRMVLDAQHELMTRRDQGPHADPRPYVVVVDEVPEMLRVLNARDTGQLRDALDLIGAMKGRKYGVAAIMLGQGWSKAIIGSTTMRDLVPTSAVFQQRAEQAELMCGIRPGYWRAVGPDPFDLQPGEFYMVGVDSGAVRVRVPKLPSHSPSRAGAREPLRLNRSDHFAATSPEALPKWDRSGPEVAPEVESEVAPALPEQLPETEVVRLLRKGYSPSRVVRELTGQNGGERYQRLTQALSQWLVRRALGS